MKEISRAALLEYIKTEEIAFQFIDGLMVFTKPHTNVYLDEYDENEVEDMKTAIKDCKTLKVVKPNDVMNHDYHDIGFNEFARWSQPNDLLILVDDNLLLCLPNYENYNQVILEVA